MPPVNWDHDKNSFLLNCLQNAINERKQSNNGWKRDTWRRITFQLNARFGVNYTYDQLKNNWQNLRKKYILVKDIRSQSGFGWDNEKMIATATDEVWDAYIASHPKAKLWRNQAFPHYDRLHSLLDGKTGTRDCSITLASNGISYSHVF